MIRYLEGDLFSSDADALVNPVNCDGVMGKGLALEFKRRFPKMFERYRQDCLEQLVRPGSVIFYAAGKKTILSFATKDSWRNPSRLEWIEEGLQSLARMLGGKLPIEKVAMPKLGCGLGGLDWAQVKPRIEQHLGQLSMDVEVYT